MKVRFAAIFSVLAVCALCVLGQSGPVRAQGETLPPPPAFVTGQRLQQQAQAAATPKAAKDLAQKAVSEYKKVAASATYRHSTYAAQALYQEAQVQEHLLSDKWGADQTYQTLHNSFAGSSYPIVKTAEQAQATLEKQLDQQNKTNPRWGFLYATMDFMVRISGGRGNPYSYALAILLLSFLVKAALTPLSRIQYKSMGEMQKLQPILKELQAKYKGDPQTLFKKQQEIQKEHGVSMYGGCLPMLVQLPILYLLYYAIRLYQFQFSHGKFLWIGSSLSHQYPSFLGANLGQQDIPILVLYALSMYVSTRMSVTPTADPKQAEQQRMMSILTPFMSTYFFLAWHLPSAFVLYYFIFNVFSTVQQKYYMKSHFAGNPPGTGLDGGGGSKRLSTSPQTPSIGGGSAKALPNGSNGRGNGGGRRANSGRSVPLAEAKDENAAPERAGDKFSRPNGSGAAPTARGVIAPPKIHPKKKKR